MARNYKKSFKYTDIKRSMDIIEQFSKGKNDTQPCEDRLVITDDYVAVIDGSTSKGNFSFGGMRSGFVAAKLVGDCIAEMSRRSTVGQAARLMTNTIADFYNTNGLMDRMKENPADRPTCSVVIYSDYRREIWQIGDCLAKVGGTLYENSKPLEAALAKMRSTMLRLEMLGGKSVAQLLADDTGRKAIMPLLKQQCVCQNNPDAGEFAYGVVDGFKIVGEHIKTISLADYSGDVILASDGYPVLCPTLYDTEAHLAAILKEDPLCYDKNMATKAMVEGNNSFDDRTYVRFQI